MNVAARLALWLMSGGLVAGLCLGSAGCAEDAVETHEVPKGVEQIAGGDRPQPEAPRADDRTPGSEPADAGMPWTVPASWRESDERPPMRLATYVIDDEDGPVGVAVTRFAGDVGGMLANVNRWRSQIGLGPVAEEDLPALLERFDTPGFVGSLLHLRGEQEDMLAASIYEPSEERTWFVRVVAPAHVAERVKQEVFEFARSFSGGGG